jgi:uncharacterized DUF497 family protein
VEFRWNAWNISKCEKHGVDPDDAEYVASHPTQPFPQRIKDERYLVWGQEPGGRYLLVIYVFDDDGTTFIIHARPLKESEKRQLRRRRR